MIRRAADLLPAETYSRVFEADPNGVAILDELTRLFARPAVVEGGIDAILKTYQRDGARRVVEYIINKINEAHDIQPPEDDPDA